MPKPTAEQVRNEPAGPRLDAWASQYVEGVGEYVEHVHDLGTQHLIKTCTGQLFLTPAYSSGTNPGSAWVLVEAIKKTKPRVQWHFLTELLQLTEKHKPLGGMPSIFGLNPWNITRAAILAKLEEGK